MKVQHSHQLITSFYLWLDHTLLSEAEAFENKTGQFYQYSDTRLPLNSVYGSPHAQFVYDSSITGANLISGAFDASETFIGRGTSGMKVDYNNGRVIFDDGIDGITISGSYAVKDFNIYLNPRSEVFLLEEAFNVAKEKTQVTFTNIPPYKIVAPCVIVKYNIEEFNEPFAFGGEDWTNTTIKTIFISDNYYKLNGALSALKDRNHTCFANISNWEDLPFNYYGELKTGYYNYEDLSRKYASDKVYIEKVVSHEVVEGAKVQDDIFYIGFVEFDVGKPRFPRQ